jgi:glycosyltransferase involved in cell wall biosynthesis
MATSANNSFKLSIGLERFLAQALDCLLAQTFQDFEIIISDNASTDRTSEICRHHARANCRVRYVRNQRNPGAITNFNRVFERSTAPLFKWVAHDDLYRERYLESCVRLVDENPDVIVAHPAFC